MSTYKKDFTIRPAEGKYLNPWDCSTILQDGQECCVKAGTFSNPVCAFYRGGGFFAVGNGDQLFGVTEATPIPHSDLWPDNADWSTDDWEERGIYPPRPVQPAVLIVELSDGRTFEIPSPYTDETPVGEKEQKEYQDDLADYEARLGRAWFYGTLPQKASDKSVKVTTRWAWQENPKTK